MSDEGTTEGEEYREEANTEAVGGAIGGMTGGGVVGGLAMGTLGPLGAVLGLLAGYAGGWWAGEEMVAATEGLDDLEERLRALHEKVGGDRPWTEARHAYRLGYLAGRNPRSGASEFEGVEDVLRRAWTDAHDGTEDVPAWNEIRDHARRGWDVGRDHL